MKKFLLAAAALVAAQGANAVVVTVNGSFTATDWSVYFGSPSAPIDPLFMDYSATFDDTVTYLADASILNIISTNVPYPVTFSFDPGIGVIIIATYGDTDSCTHLEESFCAFVDNFATGTPSFVEQSPAGGGGWVANTITGGVVPEPASWALMIAGFGMVGGALRRRQVARTA